MSNLGMYGITSFDAIINPPQVAILSLGDGEECPVVVDGEVQVKTVVTLTMASDHRIVDGAKAAQFISVAREILESPAQMLV
ncbi:2-oxo acid dehydrogenase subunit E2 [Cutibacterium sp. V947]|uniref:2-oxo acid dehydrogenase subunit E2 n=1 Tax=unclassified Cutibacterium TaxID=2649671 RepID=UPI003EE226F6